MSDVENKLTMTEVVEWEGLCARNRKGLVVPGSVEARRLEGLTRGATGDRSLLDAPEVVAEMGRDEAMQFYGIGRWLWYEMEKMGRESRDPVPWGNAAAMPAWFSRMRAAGLRKHSVLPGKVQLRADEARLGAMREPAPVKPDAAPEPEPEGPQEHLHLGEAASADEILNRYLRIAAALGKKYEEAAAAGEMQRARDFRAEMDTVTDRARQWALNAPKLREAEGWVRPDVFAQTARQFFERFWRVVKLGLRAGKSVDELQNELPSLLPAEFNL